MHVAGHDGGHHRDGQQQQAPAARPDVPPQASRTRARLPHLPHQDERDASEQQQRHQVRENHRRRLLSQAVLSILARRAGARHGPATPIRGGPEPPIRLRPGQPVQGLGQHLGALAEGEADVAAGRFGVVVEDGGGDGDHAGAVGQGPAELHAVVVAQAA